MLLVQMMSDGFAIDDADQISATSSVVAIGCSREDGKYKSENVRYEEMHNSGATLPGIYIQELDVVLCDI